MLRNLFIRLGEHPLKDPDLRLDIDLARDADFGQIVALVKTKKAGLRSEEIRKALKLDVREVPRVLKEGLAKKALKSKGQKRATAYTAA